MGTIVGGTWTYSGDPAASSKDAVRHLIGDTNQTDQQLSDQEILYELSDGGSVRAAAANAARSLGSRYALQPTDKKVGDFSITYGERADRMQKLAAELNADAALAAVPYAGGISFSDKETTEDDTDRVPPAFFRGMHDHPDASWPDVTDGRGYDR